MSYAAYWAGIPCAVASDGRPVPLVYTHARGLEPATAVVSIPRRLFSTLVPTPPADPFKLSDPQSPALIASLNSPTPTTEGPPVPMPYVGDLVIVDDDGEGTPRVTIHQRQMYLVEAQVLEPEFQDRTSSAADPLLAIHLVGIQSFWTERGEITRPAGWNVLRGQRELRPIASVGDVIDDATQAALDELRYTARSSKNGGRDPIPLLEILQECFDALPGALRITRFPPSPPAPENVRAWGASPREMIARLLSHHGLHPHVGPDLQVRIFARGGGVIGQAQDAPGEDNDQAHDPETGAGAWAKAVVAGGDRYTRRPTHRPDQVLVVGERTVMDVTIDFCRPVLYYQEAPKGGQRPAQPVVLEVTPDNLAALASGRQPGEAAEGDALATFLLSLSPADAAGIVSPFPPTSDAPPPELPRLTWQRLALVDDASRWSQVIPGLAERVRDLLRDQLPRVFQVPKEFRRLLPLDDRAARDHKRRRLPIKVEAYGFRAIRGVGKRPPPAAGSVGEAEADLPNAERSAREELVDKLEGLRRSIEEDRKRIKLLTGPTSDELLLAIDRHHKQQIEATGERDSFLETLPSILGVQAEQFAQRIGADPGTGYGFLRYFTPVGFGEVLPEGVEDPQAAETVRRARETESRLFNAWVRKFGLEKVFGVAPEELDEGQVKAQIKVIEERIKQAETEYRKLERELNPKLSRQNELAGVEAELSRIRAQQGREDRALRARAKALQDEIEKLEEQEFFDAQRAEEEVETVTHVNLARREVPFTVLDRALGIIRVDTPDPPVWLANTGVADPAETFAYFMPVRITFGTANGTDADQESQVNLAAPSNFYTSQILQAVAEVPDLGPLVGALGHVLPLAEGERRTAFGFTREDVSGSAQVDPRRARRFTVPGLQEFVELGGRSNRDELRARGLVLAQAVLDQPADLPDGSLVLRGARVVLCNGVISAVEVRLGPEGLVTEVSFHVDTEPLPGVEGEAFDPEDTTRFVFGLDVEDRDS